MRSRPAAQGVQTPRLGQVMGEKVAGWGGGGHQKDSSCVFFSDRSWATVLMRNMGMGQYLYIPFLMG